MTNKLTDTQERLLAAIKREMVEVTQPIMDEIARLRQEQRELHERGQNQQTEIDQIKRVVRRMAYSLLALIGDKPKEKE
jgi:hypothetical protein